MELGKHIVAELYHCNALILDDVSEVERIMLKAAEECGATVITSAFHHFSPYGVSGVVVIQESHLAIHTWPEYGYASVDLYTCGEQIDNWVALEVMKSKFEAKEFTFEKLKRGEERFLINLGIESKQEELTETTKFHRNVWFTERNTSLALSLRYSGELLYKKKTKFQEIKVLESIEYGKMLISDGAIQVTAEDEFHYHETMAHHCFFEEKKIEKVLIVGGGDGGLLKEICKYSCIKEVTVVEQDEAILEASKLHFSDWHDSFRNEKVKLCIEDANQFVTNLETKFDLILVDWKSSEEDENDYSSRISKLYLQLSEEGSLLLKTESPKFNRESFEHNYRCYSNLVGTERLSMLTFFAPTYPSGMGVILKLNKGNFVSGTHVNEKPLSLKYYNEQMHKACTALPSFILHLIDDVLKK